MTDKESEIIVEEAPAPAPAAPDENAAPASDGDDTVSLVIKGGGLDIPVAQRPAFQEWFSWMMQRAQQASSHR